MRAILLYIFTGMLTYAAYDHIRSGNTYSTVLAAIIAVIVLANALYADKGK